MSGETVTDSVVQKNVIITVTAHKMEMNVYGCMVSTKLLLMHLHHGATYNDPFHDLL